MTRSIQGQPIGGVCAGLGEQSRSRMTPYILFEDRDWSTNAGTALALIGKDFEIFFRGYYGTAQFGGYSSKTAVIPARRPHG